MDDSLIAPEYKLTELAGKVDLHQSNHRARHSKENNKNDAADDNVADGGETSANI